MLILTIEKENNVLIDKKMTIEYIIHTEKTRQNVVDKIEAILPTNIKVGFGGHHVWIADEKNERIAIISGF